MRHRPHLLLHLCICVLFLSGCEFKDIDKRLFVLAIGIDKAEHLEKGYRVSLKMGLPKGANSGTNSNFLLLTEEQETISEAVQLIKSKVDKEPDFGHAKALILGKSLVNEDYREALDWLNRQRFIQAIAWMGVGQPSAYDVLKVQPKSEELPANTLFLSFGQTGVESQYILSQYMFEFYRNSKENGITPALPYIEARDDYYEINQACLFDQEELILLLSPEHTKLLNMLSGRIEKNDFKINYRNQTVVVHIQGIKVNHSLHMASTKPTVTVNLTLEGMILERSTGLGLNPPTIEQVSQTLAGQIETDVTALLEKFQEYKLDPVGFGLIYRSTQWRDPDQEWKEWQKLYPKVKFQVQAKVEIRATGTTQ